VDGVGEGGWGGQGGVRWQLVIHNSYSMVAIRLHPKNQLPRLSRSELKV
jgi:hypothetical protein